MHKAVAAKDLHAFIHGEGQDFAAVHFGQRGFNGVLFDGFKRLFRAAGAMAGIFNVGGGTEDSAFGSICFGGHTSQLLLNHAKLVQKFAEGFALSGVGCGQAKGGA